MGAGMSALSKVRELQELGNKDAMAQLQAVDVPKAHAKTVLKRIRAMQTIDAQTVAELVDGLPGETQDAPTLGGRRARVGRPVGDDDVWERAMANAEAVGWAELPKRSADGYRCSPLVRSATFSSFRTSTARVRRNGCC